MSQDDFNFEPVRGLPERLPPGEHILWQGSPDPRALAREALSQRWVAAYFGVLAFWRFGTSMADYPLTTSLGHAVPLVLAGVIACAILYVIAWVQAKATVYTITNKRVAMRIGAALTMTLNLPFVQIGGAELDHRPGGTGTIAFSLLGETRLSYLMTWPHVRPWVMARTQPALRCIPDAGAVARIFADAAETRVGLPQVTRAANDNSGGNAVPAE
jgi:hypothetical protein